jgi:hypothetical protein
MFDDTEGVAEELRGMQLTEVLLPVPILSPCRRSAASNASHTVPAVARRTSLADTPNRELSSIPDSAFSSVPSVRWKPPTTSI